MDPDHVETIVIGGSQAGLAVGYHLRRRGVPFVIVDENKRVGDAWRNRWDTLRLFTPARYSGLPGMRFPGPASAYPTKDDTANYLETYTGVRAASSNRSQSRSALGSRRPFRSVLGDEVLSAENVVVATGAYHHPRVPAFASGLDGAIIQAHSSSYRNRSHSGKGESSW